MSCESTGMYRYEFDHTTVGDFRFSREEYELLQEALRLLRDKLRSWDELARSHGALNSPYQFELKDLDQMICWWDGKLQDNKAREIRESGLSVGTLRYIKAALSMLCGTGKRKSPMSHKQHGQAL